MKLFIKIERKLEAILATILIILAPIGCIFAGIAWVYSSIGCIRATSTIDYITYDIIAPTILVTGLVAMIIWIPQVIWGILSYLFKRIKKAWKN